MLPRKFSFTSTKRDLLDANKVHTTISSSVQPFLRIFYIGLGLFWACGPIVALIYGYFVFKWIHLLLWLTGCSIVWFTLIQPGIRRYRITSEAPDDQGVTLTFSDNGIDILLPEQQSFNRPWNTVQIIYPHKKGILLGFTDGCLHWLPVRVFQDSKDLNQFAQQAEEKIKSTHP